MLTTQCQRIATNLMLLFRQEKNRHLNAQLKTASKASKSLLRKADSLFDDHAMKNIFKKRQEPGKLFGKENSTKKAVRESKSADTLTTVQKSPEKLFKQSKINFAAKPAKQLQETEGNDSTFCETLATSGIEKSALVEKSVGPSARSTPQRKPFCLETTDQEQLKEPDVPAIKKEKLSPEKERFVCSDLDIFASDCEVMEAEDFPISIRDSNESGDSLVERLMAEVEVIKEEEVPSPIIKLKRRTRFYGECRDCTEVGSVIYRKSLGKYRVGNLKCQLFEN